MLRLRITWDIIGLTMLVFDIWWIPLQAIFHRAASHYSRCVCQIWQDSSNVRRVGFCGKYQEACRELWWKWRYKRAAPDMPVFWLAWSDITALLDEGRNCSSEGPASSPMSGGSSRHGSDVAWLATHAGACTDRHQESSSMCAKPSQIKPMSGASSRHRACHRTLAGTNSTLIKSAPWCQNRQARSEACRERFRLNLLTHMLVASPFWTVNLTTLPTEICHKTKRDAHS